MSEQSENAAGIEFTKGHGTQNDFVVLPDPDATLNLSAERVTALCDRRRGIGADGVLRVARAGALAATGVLGELPPGVAADDWFMDYRNADGSIAEMCGNGVRVFAHYLVATGMDKREEFVVGSRAGARPVTVHAAGPVHGEVTVTMGSVRQLGESTATIGGDALPGLGIDVGNPHLACVDPRLTPDALAALDLSVPPGFDPEMFPQGVNVEILTALGSGGAVDMRVYERGVGETRSCGTGTVAAAAAALVRAGFDPDTESGQVRVRIPGGEVTVGIERGEAWLRGPSVLLASGRLAGSWWYDA
ncbi:diaminopimelate epimerase [Nocardia transvalensis]|uniref:Diaminopimelate epimerase n=1 Tax=Nocardia transvalensis TaxID=37333 RepID=A0A7W9P905_9NOCA|nr:diaminopimelate epimerase [Nocardia transvalensis]MBB5911369.1 diaminopimelate epimerase [Nocardia transvalensis]